MGFQNCCQGLSKDWNIRNSYFLVLMSLGYVIGEIAHFLIITTSRSVARDVQYGDKGCYDNSTFPIGQKDENINFKTYITYDLNIFSVCFVPLWLQHSKYCIH